jgi:hypothetical protein
MLEGFLSVAILCEKLREVITEGVTCKRNRVQKRITCISRQQTAWVS